MNASHYASQQYALVKDSRETLLKYCNTVKPGDFLQEHPGFGRGGSMRNLLVHIANVYEYWVAEVGLKKQIKYTSYESCKNTAEVSELFIRINKYVDEFIEKLNSPEPLVSYEVKGERKHVTLFALFSHVITHEYHHKGQILTISRQLGYTPADTDMIR